jgi:hypothetical protein
MPYYSRNELTLPERKRQIWRYISIPQLISILDKESLWFSRTDLLKDTFEGSISEVDVRNRTVSGEGSDIPAEFWEELARLNENQRKVVFVNCWYINKYESVSMWNSYGDQGVAIRSTIDDFVDCFDATRYGIAVGKVKYIDYTGDAFSSKGLYSPYFHKRQNYESERELRAATFDPNLLSNHTLLSNPDIEKKGLSITVNIDKLVNGIRLPPDPSKLINDAVDTIGGNSSFEIEIEPSQLDRHPIY